ncbi:hypothetical protein Glove_79g12 [Diversispora epigaea]|uniref:Serine-threonine/tyrosine-protein kinase catalytic domain-containing protein n=1 Tax=Diversispora epigaea TaxID=1348612 RepID=A0A397JIY2_9GLOM|nr:hypothetical protein Glove_79g12 [Diversispora epigaea]
MHRDLFSGNILYSAYTLQWKVSDLGLSGPNKPLNILWEVITGEIPYGEHEYAIVSGYRPKIYENIPLEYATLMKQCWDANFDNRPDTNIIIDEMKLLLKLSYEEMDKNKNQLFNPKISNQKSEISLNLVLQKMKISK